MKKIVKNRKEKKSVPQQPELMANVHQVNRNLVENEKFVKKLERQIDIIKKIIDTETGPAIAEDHRNTELQIEH